MIKILLLKMIPSEPDHYSEDIVLLTFKLNETDNSYQMINRECLIEL